MGANPLLNSSLMPMPGVRLFLVPGLARSPPVRNLEACWSSEHRYVESSCFAETDGQLGLSYGRTRQRVRTTAKLHIMETVTQGLGVVAVSRSELEITWFRRSCDAAGAF